MDKKHLLEKQVLVLLALVVAQAVDPMDHEGSRVGMEALVHFGLATWVWQEAPNCEETWAGICLCDAADQVPMHQPRRLQ